VESPDDPTPPTPRESARHDPVWARSAVRLAVLLACLAALAGVAADRYIGSASGSSSASSCVSARLPSVAALDVYRLAELRAGLLGVVARAGGSRYAAGTAEPRAPWSDNPPAPPGQTRAAGGTWPGAYEIRQWSSEGDNVASDAFEFADRSQAARFFDAASAARCHRAGASSSAIEPPQARVLTWLNPDAAQQADVLLLRGTRVYRVAVVRGARLPRLSPAMTRKVTVATASRLACELPAAGCTRAPTLT
jgi:hypothetical protein